VLIQKYKLKNLKFCNIFGEEDDGIKSSDITRHRFDSDLSIIDTIFQKVLNGLQNPTVLLYVDALLLDMQDQIQKEQIFYYVLL
jgi:DNA recombination-dependent growth factor C